MRLAACKPPAAEAGRLGLRVEARDCVSRFEPMTEDGDAKRRNDVTVAAGLTVRF